VFVSDYLATSIDNCIMQVTSQRGAGQGVSKCFTVFRVNLGQDGCFAGYKDNGVGVHTELGPFRSPNEV
jgi:hypothetical protein